MPKIFMASLGCVKNLVDAETMLGETLDDEFVLELDPASADVIIVNTCGFIEDAREEAREVIGEYLKLKKRSRRKLRVVAAGCWAERCPDGLLEEFPGLDAAWGLSTPSSLRDAIRRLGSGPRTSGIGAPARPREGARLLTTPASFAYLRISDGCDNRCGYCAIPLIRGGLKSRLPGAIVEEAKIIEQQGVKELVIIGQDTTAYGADLHDPAVSLESLLGELLAAVSVPRIRVLYAHPAHLTEPVIQLLLSEPRLCRYLDLPLQHVATGILIRMGRGHGRERVLELTERFSLPDFTLRTTFLTGFPGEGEEDFREILEVVEKGCFRHLGAFAYSPERGTPAAGHDGQIPPEEAARRRDAVMEAQSRVAFSWLDSRVGRTESLLVDSSPGPGWLTARSISEAPDADGAVHVRGGKSRPGEFVDACIKSRDGYDLIGETTVPGPARCRRK